jgi:hypothetical protein
MKAAVILGFVLTVFAASSLFAAPDCQIVTAGNNKYLVLFGIPAKNEFIGTRKHSEHLTLEQARTEVRAQVKAGKCQIDKLALPECALAFISFGEGGGGFYALRQIPSDRTDQRFFIPALETQTEVMENLAVTLKDFAESDVPVCRRPTKTPKCALRPSSASNFTDVELVLFYSDGTELLVERMISGTGAISFMNRLSDQGLYCK